MCLAIPGKVIEIQGSKAKIEIGKLIREASIELLDKVNIGNYVLLHAGFAIQKLDEKDAEETLNLLRELAIAETTDETASTARGTEEQKLEK